MGHIFFIAPNSDSNLDEIAEWTLYWLLEHNLVPDTAIYNCHNLRQALVAIEAPLAIGEPPALIVLDHATPPQEETLQFATKLHNCIPESWIVEITPRDMPLPHVQEHSFWIQKPVSEADWKAVLEHVFLKAGSPQWTATTL